MNGNYEYFREKVIKYMYKVLTKYLILAILYIADQYPRNLRGLGLLLYLWRNILEKEFKKFYNNLLDDIEELKCNIKSIKFEKILGKMGFPENYKLLLKIM